jgi:deoxyhypusine synthase
MSIDRKVIEHMFNNLSSKAQARLKRAVKLIVNAKEKGGKIVAVVGSGPNLHEGVTSLIAELIHKGIIDGVSTSSAVINHEMAGTLEIKNSMS